jgi:3-oxoacyl-[acyl-carrier protein] reductase
MHDMTDSRVLVTGSSRGIGAAIAAAFGRSGARVALHGRDRPALARVEQTLLQDGVAVTSHVADLTDPAAVDGLRDEIGSVDVLVVNAGGAATGFGPLEGLSVDTFRQALDDNLVSAFLTLKAFLPAMKEQRSGAVVMLSSASAVTAHERNPIGYAAAKAGIESLTKNLAVQLGPHGIRVNCIAPETILTDSNRQLIPPDVQSELARTHPLQRLGQPQDVAELAVYLASDQAGWISGTVIDVAGGAITR